MLRASSRLVPQVLRSTTTQCAMVQPIVQRVRYYATEAAAEKKAVPPHISAIVDQIAKLNILEVSDLVKNLQDKLGLSGAIPMMSAGGPAPAAPAAAAPPPPPKEEPKPVEKSEFTVKLNKMGEGAKYKIIKALKDNRPALSLMETRNLVEKLPSVILDKGSKEDATKLLAAIKEAGGECEMVS